MASCSRVTIHNTQWWGDEGTLGAESFDTLDPSQSHLDKIPWDKLRLGMICGTAAAFAELKREVETFCNNTNECDYQTQQAMVAFFNRAEQYMKLHHSHIEPQLLELASEVVIPIPYEQPLTLN